MNKFSRSWALMKTSFSVIGEDKELLLFPLLSGIFSLIFSIAMLVPTGVLMFLDSGSESYVFGPLQLVATFATYFGLAFTATFFNVCVVYTTRVRLSGGDATFMDSIRFALSRAHLIAGWSLLSASVGLFLRGLDQAADNAGAVGEILISILRGILGAAWTVMTLFVVPSMVYRDHGPIDAIKDSIDVLKRTWGESLVRHYGLGFAQFIVMIPGFLALIGAFALMSASATAGMVLLGFSVLYLLSTVVLFGLANSVFNTALYHYAVTQNVPSGFDADALRGALGSR
ncbi:MAG: DUF6159 family protein [Deltaproteobacteria bacterium]|nr:DUF6159 family protein [Deltaproteobacteria bacterium]